MREDSSSRSGEQPPRKAGWLPRRQSPAESYTSMRAYREAAQRQRQSGEMPVVPPPLASKGGAGSPMPRPGAPLFGPHGLVTGPLPTVRAPLPSDYFDDDEDAPRYDIAPPPGWETDLATPSYSGLLSEPDEADRTALGHVLVVVAEADDEDEMADEQDDGDNAQRRNPRQRQAAITRLGRLLHRPSRRTTMVALSLALVIGILVLALHPILSTFAAGGAGGQRAGGGGNGNGGKNPALAEPSPTPLPVYLPVSLNVDHPPPALWATSAVVMDETNGTLLYAKNPNQQLPMASTTKLMTAVVALAHARPDQVITVTPDAANTGGARVDLHTDEQFTLTDLLYAMLLVSGNDAAEAIADGVGGDVNTFVGWMNTTAAALGMTNTHFKNPHGLDEDGHYSSAKDLAILGRYALSLPLIHQISGTETYTITASAHHPEIKVSNLHQPLWWYPGADGGKPGWTDNAQFVDILSAVRNGHHLIAVIMHSLNDWVTDIRNLLNWGFDDYTWVSPREIDQQHWIPFDDAYSHFTWDVPSRTLTVDGRVYYPYTGFTLEGIFLAYFNAQGGLRVFGYPRSMPAPDQNGQLTQLFDNARIICVAATGACQTGPKP